MGNYGITSGQKIKRSKQELAKCYRREMTTAEEYFWEHVRRRRFPGLRFRRQQVVDGFILDFYCAKLKIAIEIDGDIHDRKKQYDDKRTGLLKRRGIIVMRFSNEEVLCNINAVLNRIIGIDPSQVKICRKR